VTQTITRDNYRLDLTTDEAAQKVAKAIEQATLDALDATVRDAQDGSPKVTGKNAASIESSLHKVKDGEKGSVYTTSGYGGWIERGTRYMGARPYIYPAVQRNLPSIFERARALIAQEK
jgi:HK97 gp10 family phage protein